jgi:hypothetical protein
MHILLSHRTPDQIALWAWVDYETFDWRRLQGWSHVKGLVCIPTKPGVAVLIAPITLLAHTHIYHSALGASHFTNLS